MVKHIVAYTFKEGIDKNASVKLIGSLLEPLVGKIPGLLAMEIRSCFQGGMDYCLYSEFESRQALIDYAEHPLHLAAKEQFFHLLSSRVAADYEV
ncbi:MAG: Dabb family protein [Oscillospiraceae bacterium]|nr:Dabb family protein [Oscillospiraceae bacterium]